MKNVWITPTSEMWIDGRKVIKILCEPTQQDIRIQNQQKSELGKSKRRPVKCITTNRVYQSIKDAAKGTGVQPGAISRICNGYQKTSNGFTFKFQ